MSLSDEQLKTLYFGECGLSDQQEAAQEIEQLRAEIRHLSSPPAPAKDGMSERERNLLEAARKALPILRDAMAMNVSGDPCEFGGGFADRLAHDAVEEALAAYKGKEEGE